MIYETQNGTRVVIREQGPPGKGLPNGGTPGQVLTKNSLNSYDFVWSDPEVASGAVTGPNSSTDGNFALWDGILGNKVKNSPFSPATFATIIQLGTKVDKVDGFALTQNNFSNADKAKLDALPPQDNFRGNYTTLLALQTTVPAGNPGDYAYVLQPGVPAIQYLWDVVNAAWVEGTTNNFTGADIATRLFAEPDTNNFTDYYQTLADSAVQTTTFDAVVTDFQNQINAINPSSSPGTVRSSIGLATTDAVAFGSVQTAAVNGAQPAMQFGQITPITASSMTALGFTHQQAVSAAGTVYYVPMKSTAWA